MEIKKLTLNMKFENETVYTAEEKHYDIYKKDTVNLTDPSYLSIYDTHFGSLDTAFYLNGLKNVTLDFNRATLTLHGRIQPFILDNCENVTIKNVIIEYERAVFTEFEIIGRAEKALTLKPLENFPCKVENGYLIPYCNEWENRRLNYGDMFMQSFDNKTRQGWGITVIVIGEEVFRNDSPPCEVLQMRVREENGNIIMTGKISEAFQPGQTVVLSHEVRDKSSAFICRSENITVENYRIINGAGMGIISMYVQNLTIDGLNLTKDEKSKGMVTNAADAMHLVATKGKLEIKNCTVEGMIDDALNIHTLFYEAESADGNTLKVYRHQRSHCLNTHFKLFGIGDKIAVYKGQSLELKQTATITGITQIDSQYMEFATDIPLENVEKGDIVENLSTQPEVHIHNCTFGKSNTHLRIQTRGKTVIENCETELPILLTGDTNYWFEASPAEDFTVRNCKFTGNRAQIRVVPEYESTENAKFYHCGITVENNIFDDRNAMECRQAKGITFRNNKHSDGTADLYVHLNRSTDFQAE